VRTPYERHYLLLGALHTRLVFLQAAFHSVFSKLEPLEVLENYTTPKLRTVLQILRRFDLTRPIEPLKPTKIDEDDDDKDAFDEDDEPSAELAQSKKPKDKRRKFDPNRKTTRVSKCRKKPANTHNENQTFLPDAQVNGSEVELCENTSEKTQNCDNSSEKAKIDGVASCDPELTNGKMSPSSPLIGDTDMVGTEDELVLNESKRENSKFRRPRRFQRRHNRGNKPWEIPLCGILFVKERMDARIM